jgi:hypothetical protein
MSESWQYQGASPWNTQFAWSPFGSASGPATARWMRQMYGASGDTWGPWVRVDVVSPPRAWVYQSGGQTLTNDVSTPVEWNTVAYDVGGMYSASQPTRLTAPEDGLYQINVQVGFAANATGYREILLKRNGTDIGRLRAQTMTNALAVIPSITKEFSLAAGEYVEVFARQNSGANIATVSGTSWSAFQMRKVA